LTDNEETETGATPEAAPEATPAVTPEAEATPEVQAEATPEVQAEATPAVAAEATTDAVPDDEALVVEEPIAETQLAPVTDVPLPVSEPVEDPATEPVSVDPTEIIEATVEYIEEDEAPRAKPAIPGADLTPDIVVEGSDFLDAEARAAAEAEAEEAAARAAADDPQVVAQPIAEVAINLAAGARYTATGKRKTGVARVILKPGTGTYIVNGKSLEEFFPRETLQRVIRQPLEAVGYEARMDVIARMHGGGVSSQAGALRHGISRALLEADPNLRGELKRRGFLTRDPRVKERKKAGLKKARKRPQFSKR
jgi:small subunit ribosomal protein S9